MSCFDHTVALADMKRSRCVWVVLGVMGLGGCGESHAILGTVDAGSTSDEAADGAVDARMDATPDARVGELVVEVLIDASPNDFARIAVIRSSLNGSEETLLLRDDDRGSDSIRAAAFLAPYGEYVLNVELLDDTGESIIAGMTSVAIEAAAQSTTVRFVITASCVNVQCRADEECIAGECRPSEACDGEAIECRRARFVESMTCCSDNAVNSICRGGSPICPAGSVELDECAPAGEAACVPGECDAMDAHSSRNMSGSCVGADPISFYRWDGIRCAPVFLGCEFSPCEGADCDELYTSEQACIGAYLSCGAGTCESQNVSFSRNGDGACVTPNWADQWYWNGNACQRFPDCAAQGLDCTGAGCGATFDSKGECEAAFATCIDRCDDADVDFPAFQDGTPQTAYSWNGADCDRHRYSEGALCSGTDCEDEVFVDIDSCRQHYDACIGTPRLGGRSRALNGDLLCDIEVADLPKIAALATGALHLPQWNSLIMSYFWLDTALGFRGESPQIPCEQLQCIRDAQNLSDAAQCGDAPSQVCTESECAGANASCGLASSTHSSQLCSLLGGECVQGAFAACLVPASVGHLPMSRCDGDELIASAGGRVVRLSCPEHIPGTTCQEVMVHGEWSEGACRFPDATCDEYTTSGVVMCDGDDAVYCIGGRRERVDCSALGFTGCRFPVGCDA